MAQGTVSVLRGGKFKEGFAGGFFGHMTGGFVQSRGNIYTRTAASAIIGGTISKAVGGKFANGAVSAAFTHLFNNEAANEINPARDYAKKALSDGKLSLWEANKIWRLNNQGKDFVVEYDAKNITVEIIRNKSGGFSDAKVVGVTDFLVHGNVEIYDNNGVLSITSETYDFLPNPRSWYSSYTKYAVRNFEAYGGFYVASFAGFSPGSDYTIKYLGSPNVK